MSIDPESFIGRLYLLVIDKIIIAAIVGVAIVGYDQFRTLESRKYEAIVKHAELAREFLPAIVETEVDATARLYMLQAGVRSGALDADVAISLGRSLFEGNVPESDFRRVMTELIPSGLTSVATLPTTVPHAYSSERQLWRTMLVDAIPAIEAADPAPLEKTEDLQDVFYELFLLAVGNTPEAQLADRLSRSSSRGLSLIGGVLTLLSNGDDLQAIRRVDQDLSDRSSLVALLLAEDILRAISWSRHHSCGQIAESVARIATEPALRPDRRIAARVAHRELRLRAIEVLAIMGKQPNLSSTEPSQCIVTAIPRLVRFIDEFIATAGQSRGDSNEWLHESEYGREWPELVGQTVARILSCHPSKAAQEATNSFFAIGNERLRSLHPFLLREPDC